jgi:hypothetical protein
MEKDVALIEPSFERRSRNSQYPFSCGRKRHLGNLLARLLRRARKTPAIVADEGDGSNDYRAVSIVPTQASCIDARRVRNVRYLLREAPRLPLSQCPLRASCPCRYRKFQDRRTGDRRDIAASGRWFMGEDRRRSGGRRASDHHLSRIELTWPNKKS